MMASPSELSLDCKPHSYSMLLKSVGEQQTTDQAQKLEEFLSRLEEERLKIDAFKRELPLCMQLLTNAMEAYREQLQSHKANQGPKPVLEEFMPIKNASSEGSDKDKANWMTSAQLWSQAPTEVITKQQQSPVTSSQDNNDSNGFSINHGNQSLDNKQQRVNNGGAFHPFASKDTVSCQSQGLMTLPDLALASYDKDVEDQKNVGNNGNSGGVVKGGSADQSDSQTNNNPNSNNNSNTATSQTHRKARRCWSPDLHRRFVNALQMLGGSQVATPKQIRELMKVDGLTNDEVKSHLQKYRLHTRRPSPSPQPTAAAAPQLVVLGGIWVPPEYATAAHAGAPAATLYGAHHPTAHASTHYCTAAANPAGPRQEFYPSPTTAQAHHQLHHHHHHHHAALHNQLHIYNQPPPPPPAQSSPDPDVRGTGDRSESIEDGKSESGSWKADSNGENGGGGERKLVAVREEGEESNVSEIKLKF